VLSAAAVQGAEDLIGVLLPWQQTVWLTLNTPYSGYVSSSRSCNHLRLPLGNNRWVQPSIL